MTMTFNHLNLLASADSQELKVFVDILGLKEGERPSIPFKGSWLYQVPIFTQYEELL